TNGTGARFDLPPVSPSSDGRTMSVRLTATGPGIFTVAWTATSAVDGHFTAGSFAYGVQDASGNLPGSLPPGGATSIGAPVSPFEIGLRFVGFFGLAAALGAAVIGAFMWIPAGRDPDVNATPAYGLGFQVVTNVARAGAFLFALAFAGLFLLTDVLEGSGGAGSILGSTYKLSVVLSLALGAALFVLLGGFILALLLVGSVDALFRFGYGWVVLAKVALFAPMVAFGAYNRYRLVPRGSEASEPAAAFRQLTRNVRNETALGATILVL